MLMIFPIFAECKEWTLNPHWLKVLDECANGRLPSGMRMGNNSIILGKKEYKFKNDPLENFKLIIDIFKGMGLDERKPEVIPDPEYYEDWKSIRSKQIKNLLVLSYVVDASKRYNLSLYTSKRLLAFINLSFLLKQLKSSDVYLENGKIVGIEGIQLLSGDFTYDVRGINEKISESQITPDKISQCLERYIREYKNSLVN